MFPILSLLRVLPMLSRFLFREGKCSVVGGGELMAWIVVSGDALMADGTGGGVGGVGGLGFVFDWDSELSRFRSANLSLDTWLLYVLAWL
jgi:hypothetical protein